MQTITIIIPTFNEEKYVEDCLHSVSFANQIILIDSNSSDNTIELAKKFNCEIISRKFDNFSNQKNEATATCGPHSRFRKNTHHHHGG